MAGGRLVRVWWRHVRGWWLLVTAALLGAAASVVSRSFPGVAASLLAAVISAMAGVWSSRGTQALARTGAPEGSSDLLVTARGALPRVRDITDPVSVGVHPSATFHADGAPVSRTTPFVRRDRCHELEAAVRRGGLVLVVGESTAGKSRAAFEAIQACVPNHVFVFPASREAMPSARDAAQRRRRSVVWLDDLERYLGSGGLTAALLAGMLAGRRRHVLVLATMRVHERLRYRAEDRGAGSREAAEIARSAREVLDLATEIRLQRRWTTAEIGRASMLRDDSRISSALEHADRFGLSEYIAAGPQILSDWRDAWAPGANPRGAALVAAAVDVRRAGLHRALPLDILQDLHEYYLHEHGGPALRPESKEQALAWATTPAHATSSPLVPAGDDRYIAFDYLPDALDADPAVPPVLDQTWQTLIEIADGAEADDLGWNAYRGGRWELARTAFEKALEGGYVAAAVGLSYCLGEVAGDAVAATAILHTALARADADAAIDPGELRALRRALAWWTGHADNDAEALQVAQAVAADSARRLGADQPDSLWDRILLARATGWTGNASEALQLAREVHADCRRVLGDDHDGTLSSRFEVAVWTGASDDTDAAISLFEALVEDETRVFGADSTGVLDGRMNIAALNAKKGNHVTAAQIWDKLAVDRSRIQGPDHADTRAALEEARREREAASDDSAKNEASS